MTSRFLCLLTATLFCCQTFAQAPAANTAISEVFVEAESLASHGGWSLDTQFITAMGSPYLIAHGLGKPVEDAVGTAEIPRAGTYRVFVRTKDWVARWNAPGTPGRFQISINGKRLTESFGTKGADWAWHDGGTIDLEKGNAKISLHDLTGFNGRCDAIYLTTGDVPPPNEGEILPSWRLRMLGLDAEPKRLDHYDLVVIGGGYSGLGASIAAARAGCRVALIQDRGVLGGNGSSEVRVWAKGEIRRGKYPRIGEIVEEVADRATKSPGTYEEFEDAKKEAIVRAESNIELFLNHHAYEVETENNRIKSVTAFDTRSGQRVTFAAPLFADCTGHATIGYLAKADHNIEDGGRMGMSNMWAWAEGEQPVSFPETPWALDLTMDDFPYPRDYHGQWFWESGFDKDAIGDAEGIRDWNLRAAFGAFNAMKNRDGAADHETAYLTWLAYIGGPRESRQLMGDVVLTEEDIVSKREFEDGTVPSTWSIDLHYPKKEYAQKYPDNPFISIAVHGKGVDRMHGYPIPYRCFYSRNIDNLFMAGRCISVTHEALGTVRVMKTCGMMGEVVGKASALCRIHSCSPRDVYYSHLDELDRMLRLPGKARRGSYHDEFMIPESVSAIGVSPSKLPGIVVDDIDAEINGDWAVGTSLTGFVGDRYIYASDNTDATATFRLTATEAGNYDVRISYQAHPNRGHRVPVSVTTKDKTNSTVVSMNKPPQHENGFQSLGQVYLVAGESLSVTIGTKDAGGFVSADAAQLLPISNAAP
jgi:hypothetical protein